MAQATDEISTILDQGVVFYPNQGPSVIYKLIEKTSYLHEEPSFMRLIQTLFPSYQASSISTREDLTEVLHQQLKNVSMENSKTKEFIAKLKLTFSLDSFLSLSRYKRIEEKIVTLTPSNIGQKAEEILAILDEGEVSYPKTGPSIIQRLASRVNDFYREPGYVQLVKALYPSYEKSCLADYEDLTITLWNEIRYPEAEDRQLRKRECIRIESERMAIECISKLEIFLWVASFPSRALASYISDMNFKFEGNPYFVDVLTFLIKSGANPLAAVKHQGGEGVGPFRPVKWTTAFTVFLEKFAMNLSESLIPSIVKFFDEATKSWGNYKVHVDILNDVIKSIPNEWFEIDSSCLSLGKECIINLCQKMVHMEPGLCNQMDADGKTPLHNLLEKLLIDGLWKRIPGMDSLWNFMACLITKENVNMRDRYKVTPYTWILFWKEALSHDLEAQEQNVKQKIDDINKLFTEKGVNEEGALEGLKSIQRFFRIEGTINSLTQSTIEVDTGDIVEILNEGEMFCPTQGPSLTRELIKRSSILYQEPSYSRLIKALQLCYLESSLSKKEDLTDIIGKQLRYSLISTDSHAKECIAKLKIFLPLDTDLSTRALWKYIRSSRISNKENMHLIDVLSFLINEGADPFKTIRETTALTLFLEKFSSPVDDALIQPIVIFLEKVLEKWNNQNENATILNDIIKAIPNEIFKGVPSHLSPIRGLLLRNCVDMIENDPGLCDHVDRDGRTPLHNLLIKINMGDAWMRLPDSNDLGKFVGQLSTSKNVNVKDTNKVTPYSYVLLWLESEFDLRELSEPKRQSLLERIGEINKHFTDKGASEVEALPGLNYLRNRLLNSFLNKLMLLHQYINDQLNVPDSSFHRIIRACRIAIGMSLERINDWKKKGCMVKHLSEAKNLKEFTKNHVFVLNIQILEICESIFDVLIDKCSAQEIYDIFIQNERELREEHINYLAFFSVLKKCLENGAQPAEADIIQISQLTVFKCKSNETLLATVQMMEKLIQSYRCQGHTNPIEVYLNPLQDQYQVNEELRVTACRVVQGAYGTFDNCMKSESVVNVLLFLAMNDVTYVKECLHGMQRLGLQEPETSILSDDSLTELELVQLWMKKNFNWLKRSFLHLVAIFWHDEKFFNNIPEDLIQQEKEKRDVHGSTPLHIAHLHGNQSAIILLKSHEAKVVRDYFGKTPESLEYSYEKSENYYKARCKSITNARSSVFETMKWMLVLKADECEVIEQDFKMLFEGMVANYGLLDAEIIIAGSVRERLKVGRFDEVDLQICIKGIPYNWKDFGCLRLHQYLVKCLNQIGWASNFLRTVSVTNPWTFRCEREGSYNGLDISVDVVPVLIAKDEVMLPRRSKLIIYAPAHPRLLHLKWHESKKDPMWVKTICRHEWDILDNLPPECRMGILITKALLEALDQASGSSSGFVKKPITSYVVKNTLFWIVSGQMAASENIPASIGNLKKTGFNSSRGEKVTVQDEMNSFYSPKVYYEGRKSNWTSEDHLETYIEYGRLWAQKIFERMHLTATKNRMTLGSFILNLRNELAIHQLCEVLDICETCLEKLKPEVFFA